MLVYQLCANAKEAKRGCRYSATGLRGDCEPSRCCRDNSAVKSILCSYRELRFNSQHPHSCSQPSVTLIPGDLMPSSVLQEYQVCTWYTYTHIGKTNT